MKSDLLSKNVYVIGLGLCALGNICTSEMARDVNEEVRRLMVSKSSYVRKKAAQRDSSGEESTRVGGKFFRAM